jgi:cardiolipin synthase
LNINFEVNAFIYDKESQQTIEMQFLTDLEDAEVLSLDSWEKRPIGRKLIESLSKLLAPIALRFKPIVCFFCFV